MDRDLTTQAYHKAAFTATRVGIFFENATVEESLLNLSESQGLGTGLDDSMMGVNVLIGADLLLNLVNIHGEETTQGRPKEECSHYVGAEATEYFA